MAAEQEAAEEEASNLGCKIVTLDDQLTPTTQVNNFEQLLTQKVSALVVYPIVPSALAPSLGKAESASIPVISDTTPPQVTTPLPKGYVSASSRVGTKSPTCAPNTSPKKTRAPNS